MSSSRARPPSEERLSGWLLKWTNYLKGYQKRWFILTADALSYYRSPEDVERMCRGSLKLTSVRVETLGKRNIVVSNSKSQVFYLRVSTELERQNWVTALEQAKQDARDQGPPDEEETASVRWDALTWEGDEVVLSLQQVLSDRLDDLKKSNEQLGNAAGELQTELNTLERSQVAVMRQLQPLFSKVMQFKISTDKTLEKYSTFLATAQEERQAWERALQCERNRRVRLEEAVETIARQHNILEEAVQLRDATGCTPSWDDMTDHPGEKGVPSSRSIRATLENASMNRDSLLDESDGSRGSKRNDSDDDDDQFYDAEETVSDGSVMSRRPVPTAAALETTGEREECAAALTWPKVPRRDPSRCQPHRTTIPKRSNVSVNLWSILKNFIGRDLSRISMPVSLNEPLSFLQKLCEVDMEYSALLDKAAAAPNSLEELAFVAAYAITSYSSTSYRNKKPFNPLLGETFEMDRTADLGWRCLCEQVSHHPPASSIYVESPEWQFWEDYTMTTKFRGKYIRVLPHGAAHFVVRESGNHYTWHKVETTIHNIIVGKLWIDYVGEMEIINHTTQERCRLKFHPYSYFSREVQRRVNGYVYDSSSQPRLYLNGTWDHKMECQAVLPHSGSGKQQPKLTGEIRLLWKANPMPSDRSEMFYFSEFSCSLNEPDLTVAPTDSRHRPDQRWMEKNNLDKADDVKILLEEAQRNRRRRREARMAELKRAGDLDALESAAYKPRWFRLEDDPLTGMPVHRYIGGYWEGKAKQLWGELENLWDVQEKKR